jgi:tetratricopeptide (TPR) repeat protein
MKKIILIGLALILIALGLSARWWLPQILSFAVINSDAIKSITSLVQLLTWGSGVVVAIAGGMPPHKPDSTEEAVSHSPATTDKVNVGGAGGVGIGGSVSNSTIMTGGTLVQEAPRPVVTSLRQLPSPPQDFTDRETEMTELLAQFKSGFTVYVLQGLGGVGKSDLAFKLAEELSQHYGDGQIYLDLKGTSKPPLSVAEIMTHVIQSFNLESVLPKTDAGLQGLYRSVLEGKRAILLMDNVANDEQVSLLLQPNCAMVITSRQRLALPNMYDIDVNPLSPQDAREMLKKITNRINEEQADTIAGLCGCLPLALRVAASVIQKRRNLSVTDYIQRLRDARTRLELVEQWEPVNASLGSSYELLSAEQQRLFCSLAVFPDTFDDKAVVALWGLPPHQAEDVIGDLITFSLVGWNEATSRYRLQELVRIFADKRLGAEARDAHQSRHALYFLGVLREAGELYYRDGEESKQGLNLFDVEWANIQASQEWAKKHISEIQAATVVSDTYTYAGACLLALRRPPKERLDWHQTVIAAAQLTKKRSVEGSNLCFLGIAYRDLGDYDETINYCQQALEIARQEKNPREESSALSYIGVAHYYQGEYREAIDCCQRALDITRQQVGDKRSEIEQLRYLGHALRGLGQFEEAVAAYQQSLETARQIGDRNGENYVLGALGRLHSDMGKPEQAIKEYLLEAVRLAREVLDLRGEGFNLGHLGMAHRDLGQYQEAQSCYEQALPIARAIGERSIEAYCLGGLGRTHLALGQPEAALEKTSAALELANGIEMKRAQQHWGTALAEIYLHLNRLPEALEKVETALAFNSPWNTFRSFALKGLILIRGGQSQPAQEAFKQATEHARRVLEKTPSFFDARYILGLSACGMALTVTEERAALIEQAEAAYRDAYSHCGSPGVIQEALSLMDELLRVDGAEELRPVHGSLKQFMSAASSG